MEGPEFKVSELDELERIVGDETAKPKLLALSLLRDITDGFSEARILGRGGFGMVYKGVLPNGQAVAVRRVYQTEGSGGDEFENEVLTLMKVAHKNIVRFLGYCSETVLKPVEHKGNLVFAQVSERLICMEYMPYGSLDKHISDSSSGLEWNYRYKILIGISNGLRHLHDKVRIMHGDIKPENVLLDNNLEPKISDFGLSRYFVEGESLDCSENLNGTRGYIAPEMIDEGRCSFKSDIFSLGVTIMNLLLGYEWDWVDQSLEQALQNWRERLGATYEELSHEELSLCESKYQEVRTCLEIAYNCVERDPNERPTAMEIIHRLEETASTDYSGSSGHAPTLWQYTDTIEQEPEPEADSTAEFPPSDQDLSKLIFLEEITDNFSYKRIVGKDGTYTRGSHKVFVYKGDAPHRKMVAVKRFIGVGIPVKKFRKEAEQFKSLDHKNIVKVVSYCQDESRKHRLVQFKGQEQPVAFAGPEQLLCYDYMHNGSLREYLIGQGSREIDWDMRYKLIKGICKGLRYLHKDRGNGPIVHLNLCPSNVLLDEKRAACVTGFDFTKLIGEKENRSIAVKKDGQISYLPPDFFHCRGTDLKYLATVDIYSLGLMILEIATRQEIKGKHELLIKRIEENWREESQIESLYPSLEPEKLCQVKLCIDIGLDCVKSKPENRSTAGDIVFWLQKGTKLLPGQRARGGVPRPPVCTNITQADDHIQEKEKWGLRKLLGRK